jgi:hypothetical protein
MLKQQYSASLLITVSAQTVAAVRRSIHACDNCSSNAQVPLAQLLDRLIGRFHSEREYLLHDDVLCPSCMNPIAGDTLVELQCNMRSQVVRVYA